MAKKRVGRVSKKSASKPHKSSKKEDDEKMERGQMWSVDVIIGVVIFVSVIAIFYTTLVDKGAEDRDRLKSNADSVITKFTNDPSLKLIGKSNELNMSRLEDLANSLTYEELKQQLGVEGDFCIYVEDESGRIVPIAGKTSIGKGDINISDRPCGSTA